MFIVPMQKIDGIGLPQPAAAPKTGVDIPFKSLYEGILNDVIETDKAVAIDVQKLATGQTDDLHTLMIDQAKAQLSIQLMVQFRNRLMDAYSEVMRMNL